MSRKRYHRKQWFTVAVVLLLGIAVMLLASSCSRGSGSDDEAAAPTEASVEPTVAPTEAPAEPTVAPTEAPTEAPAEEAPQAPVSSFEHTPDPMLIDFTWQWVQRDPNGNAIDEITVDTPENYTVMFMEDGTFSAKVDCNNVSGSYATSAIESEQPSILMRAGPSTMAMCDEESLDQAMLQMFGPAQNYSFQDDGEILVLNWVAAGPIDTYRKAESASDATEGEVDAGEEEVVEGADVLANMTYQSTFTQDGAAPLVDGKYEEEAAPGSATKTTVMLLPEFTATGDLNGQPSSAVILATDPGGSGTFIDLAVVTDVNGEPTNVAIESLGDRANVNTVAIENNQIVVDMITHGPDDPMCCPTLNVVQTYELQDDQLVLVNTEEIGTVEEPAQEVDPTDPDPVAEDNQAPEIDPPDAEATEPTGVVTAEAGVNIRTGPGAAYPIVGVAPNGAEGEIVGKSEDSLWWVALVPAAPDEQGWVAAAYVEVTNADGVPVIPVPPVPEPTEEASEGIDDAALASGEGYEVETGVIVYSASRIVQEGNRSYDLDDIYVVAAASDSTAELVANNAMQPAVNADRSTLAFKSMQSDKLGIGGYDLDTATRLRFTGFNEDSNPRWNPAGDSFVYASNKEGDRAWRLYVTEAVAKDSTDEMTSQELGFGLDPDWSPVEDLIAFKGCNDQGQECGLYTMDTDGGARTLVTNDPSDSRPRWFPDGSAVVFMSEGRDGNWELYRTTADGSDVTRLTDDPAPDGLPAVSPDGTQIAFMSKRGDAWGVWVIPAEGGDAAFITAIASEQPDWLVQSIDWPK